MAKWRNWTLVVVWYVAVCMCCVSNTLAKEPIADCIGKWRVEVGPPGNDFSERPAKVEQVPPSEAVLRQLKIFVPHLKMTEWELDDGVYEIKCKLGDDEYRLDVTPEGELVEVRYENDQTDIEEEADELVLRGTKKVIAVSELPSKAVATLAKAYPKLKVSKAWTAKTVAGHRYVIQIGEMVFYARSDGQIQAARRIDDGGLAEISPPGKTGNEKAFKAELEELLGPYRQRFNLENQIKKLGSKPKNADGSYRYVVMGDSRSQWALWSNMVKHIDNLDPKPAFVINSGDVVPKGYATEFQQYYMPPLLETEIPYLIAIGNHDTGDDDMAREYQYLFGDKSLNYYFDYGKTRYVFADNASDATSGKKMLKWLDKTLGDAPQGYRKYVAVHKPPENIDKWAYHAWDGKESKEFTAMMSKHGVSEVYLGHIHAYSTAELDGVKYTLSGGGGAGLHNRYGPLGNVHHYVICDVAGDGSVTQQVVRFYDTKKEDTFRFTVTGDPRNELTKWEHTLVEMADKVGDEGAFHITCGDYFQHGADTVAKDFYVRLVKQFGDDVIWYPTVGNHETQDDSTDMEWLREFYHKHLKGTVNPGPPNGVETNYSFDYKNAHFVQLNQYYDGKTDKHEDADIRDALYDWLVKDLEKNKKPLVFVIYHAPMFPGGRGGKKFEGEEAARVRFWKLLQDKKVVAGLCAHTHKYGRGLHGGNPYTWEIDVGNAGRQSHADPHQTFVDVLVTDKEVRFNTWQGDEGKEFRITDSWTVDISKGQSSMPMEGGSNFETAAELVSSY